MANWFDTAFTWPKLLFSSSGRDRLLDDIKHGEGYAELGSPLHGLTAGYEMTKLGSAYRGKQVYDRLKAGEDPFSRSFIGNVAQDQYDNISGAFKENWPVLAFMGGGYLSDYGSGLSEAFSGGSALGSGEGGAAGGLLEGGAGTAAGLGGNMLGGQQQQQPAQMMAQPNNDQARQRALIQMQNEMQAQALRQKPNKTLEEWEQLRKLTENKGLLGYG